MTAGEQVAAEQSVAAELSVAAAILMYAGRVRLLAWLKERGMGLAERQRTANNVSRGLRIGEIEPGNLPDDVQATGGDARPASAIIHIPAGLSYAPSVSEVLIDEPPPPRPPSGMREVDPTRVRLGIACMTKRPANFSTWLAYHVDTLHVERIYLRVEESPQLAAALCNVRESNQYQEGVTGTPALRPVAACLLSAA